MGFRQGEEGWTTVHYSGGRQRFRQDGRGGGGYVGRRMDRAPPGSYRGQAVNPFPTRPVPPSGPYHHSGPQHRSYAQVVRQGNWRPAQRRDPPRNLVNEQARREPTDPTFGKLVRQMHAVIKVVHHLQNVAPKPEKPQPRMIERMVEVLATMIKPASPTAETADLIRGNAINWGYTTLLVLEEHYLKRLESMLEDLERDLVPDWRPAFEVAKRWARRNLPRITQECLDHAEALVTSRFVTEGVPDRPRDTVAPREEAEDRQTTQTASDTRQETTIQRDTLHKQTRDRQQEIKKTVTDQGTQVEPTLETPQAEPRRQRRQPRGRRNTNNCVVMEESGLLDLEEDTGDSQVGNRPVQDSVWGSGRWLLDEEIQGEVTGSPVLTPVVRGSTQEPERAHQEVAQVHRERDSQEDEPSYDNEFTSTPQLKMCRVTRHINTDRKMIDWNLSVRKKWLIVGDSNLSRFPGYFIPDLQIESYPGANFRHAQALMAKSVSFGPVEKVVLAFGLNHRGQRAKETSVKQVQGAVRAAKKTFPGAEIWIPIINYSVFLSHDEQTTLQTLNAYIKRNLPYIPALSKTLYQSDKDHIHWTPETAREMFAHWVSYLNLDTP